MHNLLARLFSCFDEAVTKVGFLVRRRRLQAELRGLLQCILYRLLLGLVVAFYAPLARLLEVDVLSNRLRRFLLLFLFSLQKGALLLLLVVARVKRKP